MRRKLDKKDYRSRSSTGANLIKLRQELRTQNEAQGTRDRRKQGLACRRKAMRHGHKAIEEVGSKHLERQDSTGCHDAMQ